jgi:hypothetical protein
LGVTSSIPALRHAPRTPRKANAAGQFSGEYPKIGAKIKNLPIAPDELLKTKGLKKSKLIGPDEL